MNYAEYTGKARAALMLAEKCAKQFGQGYVGSEHILVGLLRERTGVAAVVLQDNGVNEADVIELIRDFVAPDSMTKIKERSGFSSARSARISVIRGIRSCWYAPMTKRQPDTEICCRPWAYMRHCTPQENIISTI